ncbi:MAG TPA: DUF2905 domain-containing protein [Dehalococcoidia bacterium]|nr:DUF2905 domain-containing protein [Dehalococcoidia bacterium]
MDSRGIGLALIAGGLIVALVGVLAYAGLFRWFGRLPGDIHYRGGNVEVFVPLASMIAVSVVLSLLLALISRLR